jgi:putative endonuclease
MMIGELQKMLVISLPVAIGIGLSPTFKTSLFLYEVFYAKHGNMPACYILYSKAINKFYIGATGETVSERLNKHVQGFYDNKYTAIAKDWEIFLAIECMTTKQAFAIEAHIKRMKSRKYIENLKCYPEMIEKLLNHYS